jgi:DNA-binding PadR family transcriptional regulator
MVDGINSFLQGLDRPLILWLIDKKPKHGYELIKEIKQLTGRRLKPSMIYPLLSSLGADGYVAGEWIENGKRGQKKYRLTAEGKTLLAKVSSMLNKRVRHVLDDLLTDHKNQ